MKQDRRLSPSTIVTIIYNVIAFFVTVSLSLIIPKVLNYGKGTINTPFDIQMSGISFTMQFLLIALVAMIIISLAAKTVLRDVDKWFRLSKDGKKPDKKPIKSVREKCLDVPYGFLFFEVFIPVVIVILGLAATGSHDIVMIFKVVLLVFSMSTFLSVVSYISSKTIFDKILSSTYTYDKNIGKRRNIRERMFVIILSILLASILMTSLVGYSSGIIEKEEALFNSYEYILNQNFDTAKLYNVDEIKDILNGLALLDNNETIFMETSENEFINVKGKEITDFVKEYIKQSVVDENAGRLYDSYGLDRQGASIKINTDKGIYRIGIMYDVYALISLKRIIIAAALLMIICVAIVIIFSNSISKSLHDIYIGFKNIISNKDKITTLPAISNDEIGDLVISFNDIQKLNSEHVADIENKQNMLIERERLASLGQMIGGISHSLKTPIFSISGGVEGLNDLVNEFASSIGDPTVNEKDMHDIAKDMKEWIEKIRGQLSYVSEIITTVKGQAVNLSGEDSIDFTIKELFSHTSILMKHEFQSALVTLNVENNVDDNTIIHGNLNNLVQVLNNLLSNAIQCYTNEEKKQVDLCANKKSGYIIITIRDYGPGIPKDVKNKLFKEMITTKGKDGTGLGIFMSYSMIKGKFNGDMKIDDVDVGTKFDIYIPYDG